MIRRAAIAGIGLDQSTRANAGRAVQLGRYDRRPGFVDLTEPGVGRRQDRAVAGAQIGLGRAPLKRGARRKNSGDMIARCRPVPDRHRELRLVLELRSKLHLKLGHGFRRQQAVLLQHSSCGRQVMGRSIGHGGRNRRARRPLRPGREANALLGALGRLTRVADNPRPDQMGLIEHVLRPTRLELAASVGGVSHKVPEGRIALFLASVGAKGHRQVEHRRRESRVQSQRGLQIAVPFRRGLREIGQAVIAPQPLILVRAGDQSLKHRLGFVVAVLLHQPDCIPKRLGLGIDGLSPLLQQRIQVRLGALPPRGGVRAHARRHRQPTVRQPEHLA
ncbi:hypothetical protein D3C86_1183320 [compost metagenome]